MKKIIALMLCLIMVLAMIACGGETTPEVTTEDPSTPTNTPAETTKTPDETTKAADETTEAPEATTEEQTTEAPETTASIEFDNLVPSDQSALLSVMPSTLPDGAVYTIACRTMTFDRGADDYIISGNSSAGTSFVDVQGGAVFGQAIKMNAIDNKNGNKRAEITVTPYGDINVAGARGVMFYVDFSNVQLSESGKMCTSVTLNENDMRSNGPDNATGSGIAYYYDGATWTQTTNITSCRMQIPDNFKGWVYVPSSSFYDKLNATALGETFSDDLLVLNMRCYTDGYVYSETDYIIFDEIVFVK